jgi:hypothetical protein
METNVKFSTQTSFSIYTHLSYTTQRILPEH